MGVLSRHSDGVTERDKNQDVSWQSSYTTSHINTTKSFIKIPPIAKDKWAQIQGCQVTIAFDGERDYIVTKYSEGFYE